MTLAATAGSGPAGATLKPCRSACESAWPEGLEAQFTDVELGIARTRAEYGDDHEGVHEIERTVRRADRRGEAASSMPKASISPRARSPRRSASGWASPIRPKSSSSMPQHADGWSSRRRWTPRAHRLVDACWRKSTTSDRLHWYVPYTGETPIYCPRQAHDRRRRDLPHRLGQFQQPFDGPRQRVRRLHRLRAARATATAARRSSALRHSLLAEHLRTRRGRGRPAARPARLDGGDDRGAAAKNGKRSLRPLDAACI